VARRRRKADLGEAISFDSVLTVLTVLLVLRMVFFVPMVNLDKAKTVSAKRAGIWDTTAWRVESGASQEPGAKKPGEGYLAAMALGKAAVRQTFDSASGAVWLEALFQDSSTVVVRHDRRSGRYVRLHAQARSELPSCQFGSLRWSELERQWFSVSDSVDYGDRGVSAAAIEAYRDWLAGAGR
jgi:hypothetical protein